MPPSFVEWNQLTFYAHDEGWTYVLHSSASAGSPDFVDPRGTVSQGRSPTLSYGLTHAHMPGADPWRIDALNSIYIDRRVVARPSFALAVSSLHLQGELR